MYTTRTVTYPLADGPPALPFPGLFNPDPAIDGTIPTDNILDWTQAHPEAIEDDNGNWYSGCARAILPWADHLIVAADSGGLWIVASDLSTTVIDLPAPNLTCLTQQRNSPIYAGGQNAIYQSNNRDDLTDWSPVYYDQTVIGPAVNDILIIPNVAFGADIIVVATDTGIFWSWIQGDWLNGVGPSADSYNWTAALPFTDPINTSFWSLTNGPVKTNFFGTVPGGFPTFIAGAKTNNTGVLFVGIFLNSNMFLFPSQISMTFGGQLNPPVVIDNALVPYLGTTAVASCAANPNIVYAAVGNNGLPPPLDALPVGGPYSYPNDSGPGRLAAVLRSGDGGWTWEELPQTLDVAQVALPPGVEAVEGGSTTLASKTGDNQSDATSGARSYRPCLCIAVSPTHPEVVALGTRDLVVSIDSGQTWDSRQVFHGDFHGLVFGVHAPGDPSGIEELYVACDGGIAKVPHLSESAPQFINNYNRGILTHQCYGVFPSQTTVTGYDFVSGMQDTGLAYGSIYEFYGTGQNDVFGVWTLSEAQGPDVAYDTGMTVLTSVPLNPQIPILLTINDAGPASTVNGQSFLLPTASLLPIPDGLLSPGFVSLVPAEVVVLRGAPSPTGSVNAAVALGGPALVTDTMNEIFILEPPYAQWKLLWHFAKTDMTETVTAVASDGLITIAATFSTMTGDSRVMAFVLGTPGSQVGTTLPEPVTRLVIDSNGRPFALSTDGFNGTIWTQDPSGTWLPTNAPGAQYLGLEVDDRGVLYAFTYQRVVRSSDSGVTWTAVSKGLPITAGCRDLRFVRRVDGQGFLYLATYGRGVWRTAVPENQVIEERPAVAVAVYPSALVRGPDLRTQPQPPPPPGDPLRTTINVSAETTIAGWSTPLHLQEVAVVAGEGSVANRIVRR